MLYEPNVTLTVEASQQAKLCQAGGSTIKLQLINSDLTTLH